ncbi:DNA damage-regulated autophagy modulator protein 2b [Gambusia affinis]|uniref:DNA damage-regulated autophagy modulator protein 2b n=1 Tax=Gambusia affinis TaxID=33528 RepID=UPI000F3A2E70|nr:DNA damage-regulated autophagy modulator protein 2b [Gambusia affinis]XP_043977322.1 DNA damage-regulated autophagy modulator protein 2b [Gambusia affinis]XP_043977324.1 DNA damage-regulated autophagy modulator protein 2b [Gambusia affinis]XP_043977325.1 DNA damage-regulated autophagy modulator protein 2b [Gambusia affinis]XP_043977326.1 DNA damage-regulated autophagy modulator protein 2b [Gambusia affinis]XP_043977327.1 DNA damage-regulated autophagy modulator protein 2b [Gambusia affinis]
MWWFQQGLCLLPAALVVWTVASFVFAYITAVVLRHVDPLLPYISDTGTLAPERCVFGIMMDVSAFLGIATVYVRYKQVEALLDDEVKLQRLNFFGLVFGWMSSFGMCVVASFQKTAFFPMHLVGAILTFGVGAIYILVQTLLSHYMQPHIHSKTTFVVRLSILVWTLGSIISMFVSSVIMYSSLSGVDVPRKLHWIPGEPGYVPHLVSTVSEWFLAFSFISFFLTYIRDFQKINLRAVAVFESSHLYDGTVPPSRQNRPSETSPLLAGTT